MSNIRDIHFNVAQLLKEPIGATRAYDIVAQAHLLAPELADSEPVRGHVHLLRTNRGILVTGALRGLATTQCSRCLADITMPVAVDIEEEFQPTVDVVRGTFLAVDEEDTALLIDEHHILDMSDVARQALLLEIPMQPLCRPDCAGLCPTCGKDLNSGACDCLPVEVDARWAQLSALQLE